LSEAASLSSQFTHKAFEVLTARCAASSFYVSKLSVTSRNISSADSTFEPGTFTVVDSLAKSCILDFAETSVKSQFYQAFGGSFLFLKLGHLHP